MAFFRINLQKNSNFSFNKYELFSQDNIANAKTKFYRRVFEMAKNVVPEAKDALNRFKMEAANEVGVPRPS